MSRASLQIAVGLTVLYQEPSGCQLWDLQHAPPGMPRCPGPSGECCFSRSRGLPGIPSPEGPDDVSSSPATGFPGDFIRTGCGPPCWHGLSLFSGLIQEQLLIESVEEKRSFQPS